MRGSRCGQEAAQVLRDAVAWCPVSARPRSLIQSRRYHCNFVDAANDRVLADVGLLVHDRACYTRASADIAVMEEDGVSNLGPFLDDDPGADYRMRDGSADVRPPATRQPSIVADPSIRAGGRCRPMVRIGHAGSSSVSGGSSASSSMCASQ